MLDRSVHGGGSVRKKKPDDQHTAKASIPKRNRLLRLCRISREHHMVYRVTGSSPAQSLEIAQLRYHY